MSNDDLPTRISTKRGPFAIAPVWWLEYDLTVADLRVLIATTSFADNHGNGAFPKRDVLAARARVSLSTYQRARARLEPLGLIRVEPRTRSGRGLVGYDLIIATTPAEAIRYAEQWEREHADGSSVDPSANPQVKPDGSRHDPPAHWRGADGSRHDPADGSPVDPSKDSFVVTGPEDQTNPPGGRASRRPGELELGLPEPEPQPLGTPAVVAAYVEGYTGAHGGRRPAKANLDKIGREAKRFLADDAVSDDELLAAARSMGEAGWTNLGRQLDIIRAQGPANRPSIGRRSRTGILGPAPVPPRSARPPVKLLPPPEEWNDIQREVYGRQADESGIPAGVWVELSNRLRRAATDEEEQAARDEFDRVEAEYRNGRVAAG